MAKKSNKRQLATDSNEFEKNDKKALENNDTPKKKKLKTNAEKPAKQNDSDTKAVSEKVETKNSIGKLDVNSSDNILEGKKSKKNKKKKTKEQKNSDDKTPDKSTEKTINLVRKEFFKKKREDFKEKQKLQGIRHGPFSVLEKYSLTEMKKKIAEIEGQKTLSKTAGRRLRILKKKVLVLESGDGEKSSNEQDDTSKEHKENDLQKKNSGTVSVDADKKSFEKKGKKKQKQIAKQSEKNLFIEDRVGDKKDDSAVAIVEKKIKTNNKKLKQKKGQLKEKNSGNSKLKTSQSDSDDEIDDSQELDDSKNDTAEDITEVDETINESSGGESDEDGSGDENSSEKDESISDNNAKNTQNKSNENTKKQKPKQTEKDPNKNQRYVLFVGNVSYDSTAVDLKKHFLTKVEKVKDIRIPTKPGTSTPRGFAYVEVENSVDYEKALSLHNTFLNGRQLKVEYTTSGSKNAGRNPEVIHKNKKLHALRKEGKLAGSEKFSNKRSFRRNFKNNPNKDSAHGEKFPHKPSFKTNFKKKFDKKE